MSTGPTSSIAVTRLTEERKQWRKDHPFGFYAKPITAADGSLNMMVWECGIPGKTGSPWEGGLYKIMLYFSENYPSTAPRCVFTPPLPHPNIFPQGQVCLSLLNSDWKPAITLRQVLLGIQALLDEPNPKSPANENWYQLYQKNRPKYLENVKAFAANHRPE